MFPETVLPDLVIELTTITVMNSGTRRGGWTLLPRRLVQVPPQFGGYGFEDIA